MEKEKRKRGGDVKKAPPGFYTAKEAQARLGMSPSLFRYYVRNGRIKRHVPPLRVEGFYKREEIDRLATEIALFLHSGEEKQTTETRIAQPSDAQGIVEVLSVMGWQTATADQRRSWYKVNPYQDYVAVRDGQVAGYIWAVPLKAEALEDMMSGRKRGWHIQPQDILPYEPGRSYNLYVGAATRKDVESHVQRVGFRLISGFFTFLEELAEQGITIHQLYAVSAEPEGQKLCRDLGFVEQPVQEGDKFPRFMLDLRTSTSHFAKLYKQAVQSMKS